MSNADERLQVYLSAIEMGKTHRSSVLAADGEDGEMKQLITLARAIRTMEHPKPQLSRLQAEASIKSKMYQHSQESSPLQTIFANTWAKIALGSLLTGFVAMAVFMVMALTAFGIWMAGPRAAHVATLTEIAGTVESDEQNKLWQAIADGDQVGEGQILRTGADGSATLVFYDGSRLALGPDTEIVIDNLDGSWGKALKVDIEQFSGKTTNSVVPLQGWGSYYRVQTPTGLTNVLGTVFSVAVDESGKTRIAVDKGEVRFSEGEQEVLVAAGQATTAHPEQALLAPTYLFSLQGQLLSNEGDFWVVNDVVFTVTSETDLVGDPQVGMQVMVEGRILEGGDRVADRVAVIDDDNSSSTFTGVLKSMEGSPWLVDNIEIVVDQGTDRDDDLDVGDTVEVTFIVLGDGSWYALEIEALKEILEDEQEPETSEEPPLDSEPADPVTDCTGADPHPKGQVLADRYHVEYEDIMGWFCQRFGFGEIELAYQLSDQSGMAVEDIFALRRTGLGWGQIKNDLRNVTVTPSPEVTTTEEPQATEEAPIVSETPEPEKETGCTGANPHPTGQKLAQRYGVSYEEIMGWFCQGFGFGEIDRAYSLSIKSDPPVSVSEIFAMKSSGMGWGEIKKVLNPKPEKTKKPK